MGKYVINPPPNDCGGPEITRREIKELVHSLALQG